MNTTPTTSLPQQAPGRRTRVLVVDDVPAVRRDLHVLLEIGGEFEVIGEAGDGLEAIDLAGRLHPDVVIMDLALPVVGGCQAAGGIRAAGANCRLVALTVHADDGQRRRALASGFDAFVVKGAPLEELLGAIRSRRHTATETPLQNAQIPSRTGGLS